MNLFFFLVKYGLKIRGGVEDTRLEAKAKDTKKSEAEAKDITLPQKESERFKDMAGEFLAFSCPILQKCLA